MKIFALIFTFIISIQAFTVASIRPNSNTVSLTAEQITPGHGYSMDRQSISSVECFRVAPSPYSKSESVISLDQGSSFLELEKSIKIDVSAKIGIGMFSVEADMKFMKEIKDTDYSFSINYYQYVQSEVSLGMGYGPAGALTVDGLRVYGSDDNPNPRFGLICGDKFIETFKVGAILIFSLKLYFSNHQDKSQFEGKFGQKYGSFNEIALDILRIQSSKGWVEIMAYQSGGNPAELENVLAFSTSSCSLANMNDCITATRLLARYAAVNFPLQVKLSDKTTLTPFSVGFADLQDVKWLGLKTPKSYVTSEVVNMRQTLANALLANQYYIDTFTLLAQTKLNWDKDSTLFKTILSIPQLAKLNLQFLMDQIEGGIVCYKDPEECVDNGEKILARLKPIETEAKTVLDKIKYKINPDFCGTAFYRISDEKWYSPASSCDKLNIEKFKASFIQLQYNISAVLLNDSGRLHLVTTVGNMIAADQFSPFAGLRDDAWIENNKRSNKTSSTLAIKEISQYAFEVYK